jgi:ketosteroid isomerase-like protein
MTDQVTEESGPAPGGAALVRRYWERMAERDWDGVGACLAPDVVMEWLASGERFVGRRAVVEVNRAYPEGWSIRVVAVVADGARVVSEVEVPHEDAGVFAVASVWTVRDGLLASAREYWVTCGADEPPAWRAAYASRYDGRPP